MRTWLLLSLLLLNLSAFGQDGDHWTNVPLENAFQKDSNLKKVVDALKGKIWTVSKFCLDDTCNEWPKEDIDSSYCFFTNWSGSEQGDDVFISASLKEAHYLVNPIDDTVRLSFESCNPLIIIKKRKDNIRSAYVIEHISEAGRYIREMMFLDVDRFTIDGPTWKLSNSMQHTEYRIAKPAKEAVEIIKEQFR